MSRGETRLEISGIQTCYLALMSPWGRCSPWNQLLSQYLAVASARSTEQWEVCDMILKTFRASSVRHCYPPQSNPQQKDILQDTRCKTSRCKRAKVAGPTSLRGSADGLWETDFSFSLLKRIPLQFQRLSISIFEGGASWAFDRSEKLYTPSRNKCLSCCQCSADLKCTSWQFTKHKRWLSKLRCCQSCMCLVAGVALAKLWITLNQYE